MQINDESLKALFADTHTIAALGVNNRPGEPNYETVSYEQSQGYKVIPVNPNIPSVLGKPTVDTMNQIAESVDMIHVLPHHPPVPNLRDVQERTGCKSVWIEPGADGGLLQDEAIQLGMTVITGRKFRQEHQRLMSHLPM